MVKLKEILTEFWKRSWVVRELVEILGEKNRNYRDEMEVPVIGWNSGEMPRLWVSQRILVKD